MLISNVPTHPMVCALLHFTLRPLFRSRLRRTRKPNCSLSTAISNVDFNFASFCKPCRRPWWTRSTFQHGIIYYRIVPMHFGYNIFNIHCFSTSNFTPKYRKPTAVLRVHSAGRSRFHVIAASVLSIQTNTLSFIHLFHISVGQRFCYTTQVRSVYFILGLHSSSPRETCRSSVCSRAIHTQHPRHFANVIPSVPYVYFFIVQLPCSGPTRNE